jgi:integrase
MSLDLRHSIYKRKGREGWTLEYREDGKVMQRSYDRRTEAEQAWDDVKDERRRLSGLKSAMPTFRDYADKWLDSITPDLRPSSVPKYKWALEHLDELSTTPLDVIGRESVRGLLGAKAAKLSRSSTASIGSVLHACLAEAVADGYLRTNPATGGGSLRKRRDGPKTVKAMDANQLRAFLAACDDCWRDFFHVMWALGLRPGEAMALQPGDVDFERQRVKVERTVLVAGGIGPTKGGDSSWVDLAPGAAAILRRRPAGKWLWPGRRSRDNGPMGHATVEHNFKRIAENAGVDAQGERIVPDHLTPHCLRHTFAAMHLQRGASIYYVQRMLRHSSIQITVDTYGSWLDPGKPELTAAMEAAVIGEVVPADGPA